MGELWFVGLGLGDERGLSRFARDVLGTCAVVYAEEYTSVAPSGTFERLEREVGRPIERLSRPLLESEAPILDALGHEDRVALIVVGDPFTATTHVALRIAAERAGHRWRYIPNASILTAAAGFLGLSAYRFGRTVSLPFPVPGFEPRSPLEHLAANRAGGLHTLILLDLVPEEGRFLRAPEGLAILRTRDPEGAILPEAAEIGVAARVGRDDAQGWFGPFARLRSIDFGPPMHVLVVPATDLHFEESAALERYRVPDR
ncbi:MAG TPA: diphthine synthase [Thermoplasmata archaeon]|nr:diphthine synthase [Thermoplasmata archaeon]